MRPITRGFAVVATTVLLAACGGGGSATTAPTTAAGTTAPVESAPPICEPAPGSATTTLSVEGNTWIPNAINAKVGDVIAWTNGDGVPHGVELDDSGEKCTETIAGGATQATSFSVPGTYPFHCFVHPSMKGTFTISA